LQTHDIVVIGASAGGVEALKQITTQLDPNIKAAIFAVVHVSPRSSGLLANVLDRNSAIPVAHPEDGERIEQGRVYVAPPDHHLLIEGNHIRVVNGPKHNRHRPSIDVLFRSAARHFAERAIGVVLTGFLQDGSSGLLAIKNAGGIAVIQNPDDAEVASMPRSALQQVEPDYCVPVAEIGELLNRLTSLEAETMAAAKSGNGKDRKLQKKTVPTTFTCPDCQGTIWEVEENGEIRYECRVGHSYSPDGMSEAQDEHVERSVWMALRVLEESSALDERLAEVAASRSRHNAQRFYEQKAHARKHHAAVLREFLLGSKRRHSEAEGEAGKEEIKRVS